MKSEGNEWRGLKFTMKCHRAQPAASMELYAYFSKSHTEKKWKIAIATLYRGEEEVAPISL